MELLMSTVKQWIDSNARPLAQLDPAAPLTDLEPLAAMIGDAAVVGLGESTRASRELFVVRLRMFRLLVEQLGFRALAMQDSQAVGARLDEYVRVGEGDPRRLLADAWAPWRTEETVEALAWMRSFNTRHPDDPIRIFGVDRATAQPFHYDAVIDYVRWVAPQHLGELKTHYDPIRTAHDVEEHIQRFKGTHPGRPFVEHARDAFALVAPLPTGDGRDRALHYARTITEFHDSSIAANVDFNAHARFAADAIVQWQRDSGSKITYWDGVPFIAAGGPLDVKIASGQLLHGPGGRLRRHFGERYVSVLLGFRDGRIHDDVQVPVPPPDYLEATLSQADLNAYYLDLRAPAPPEVSAWLAGAHKTRVVPGVYDPAEDAEHYVVADPCPDGSTCSSTSGRSPPRACWADHRKHAPLGMVVLAGPVLTRPSSPAQHAPQSRQPTNFKRRNCMPATVAVIGGGYGGITAARALDDVAEVVLIEPRDRFVHNIAALRALVDPDWVERMFYPYDRLLERGRVLRDRAVRVDAAAVTLSSGERIGGDYIVLATGSAYPFPAKVDVDDSAAAKAKIRVTHDALADADRVLLLGAGPVGLELAGEIKAAWPTKTVTIVDPVDDILSGRFTDEFRAELRRQLDALGIDLALGTSLREEPPSEAGEAKTFTATTRSGRTLSADIWFRCFGVAPATDYLAGELSAARQANGHVDVTPQLRLPGQRHVFAIGDITAIPEAKMAAAAGAHVEVVTANIRTLIRGGDELTTYEPGPPGIAIPLGPKWGASYAPSYTSDPSGILDAEATSQAKGADLMIDDMAEALGLAR